MSHLIPKRDIVDRLYYFGSAMAFGYGILHLFQPLVLIESWGIKHIVSDETYDFMNLLGVWILFQSLIASAIPLYITNPKVKKIFTWIHVFKNALAFLIRYKMFLSGRYHPITTGFAFSLAADGIFAIGYLLCALLPSTINNIKPM